MEKELHSNNMGIAWTELMHFAALFSYYIKKHCSFWSYMKHNIQTKVQMKTFLWVKDVTKQKGGYIGTTKI